MPGRLALITFVAIALGSPAASASPITVGEFRWDVTMDTTPGCSIDDPACAFSTFSFTYLWDGPEPAPTLTDNQLTLPDATFNFFDLDPIFGFDQIAEPGVPDFATLNTSFLFEGQLMSLGATLLRPTGGSAAAVLAFSPDSVPAPVPEPGTLSLVALGAGMLAHRLRRGARR